MLANLVWEVLALHLDDGDGSVLNKVDALDPVRVFRPLQLSVDGSEPVSIV